MSDLVRDSKLETRFVEAYTIHRFQDSDSQKRGDHRHEYWQVERTIAHGGFGHVRLERNTTVGQSGQLRAVKIIRKYPNLKAINYDRELEAAAKFSNSKYDTWFVRSFGWYEDPESVYIAMEYYSHGDLHRYLSQRSPLPIGEGHNLIFQLLEGLNVMHTNGFAHRDLKPANILIKSQPPDNWWVKIADFGISKRAAEVAGPSTFKGTPTFMAPEILGFADSGASINYQAADVWALGEIAFQLLTGRATFKDTYTTIKYCRHEEQYPIEVLLSIVDEKGAQFIRGLMEVNPAQRTSTTNALAHTWMYSLQKGNEDGLVLDLTKIDSKLRQLDVPEDPRSQSLEMGTARWSVASDTQTFESDIGLDATVRVQNDRARPHVTSIRPRIMLSSGTNQSDNQSDSSKGRSVPQSESSTLELYDAYPPRHNIWIPKLAQSPSQIELVQNQPPRDDQSPISLGHIGDRAREHSGSLHRSQKSSENFSNHKNAANVVPPCVTPMRSESICDAVEETHQIFPDSTPNKHSRVLKHPGTVKLVTFSPDGTLLASVSNYSIRLWQTYSFDFREHRFQARRSTCIAFSECSSYLAVAYSDGLIEVFELPVFRRCSMIMSPGGPNPRSLAFCSNVLIGTGIGLAKWSFAQTLGRPAEWAEEVQRIGAADDVRAISPDGKLMVVVNSRDELSVVETELHSRSLNFTDTDKLLSHRGKDISGITFCHCSDLLAFATRNGQIIVYGIRARLWLFINIGLSCKVAALAFSADSERLAVAKGDKSVTIWDAITGNKLKSYDELSSQPLTVAFSPDGTQLAVGLQGSGILLLDCSATTFNPLQAMLRAYQYRMGLQV